MLSLVAGFLRQLYHIAKGVVDRRIADPDIKIIKIKHIFSNKQLKQVFFQIYHQKYHFVTTKKLTDNKNKDIFMVNH